MDDVGLKRWNEDLSRTPITDLDDNGNVHLAYGSNVFCQYKLSSFQYQSDAVSTRNNMGYHTIAQDNESQIIKGHCL